MEKYSKKIIEYFNIMQLHAVLSDNAFELMGALMHKNDNSIIVSDNKVIRGAAKIRGVKKCKRSEVEENAVQYFAFRDALLVLAKKGVPVYFYNRVGKLKNSFQYSSNAIRRMEVGLSFPVMYGDIEKYEEELKEVFADKYSYEFVELLGKIPQVVKKGDFYCHEDRKSQYINVIDGKRVTPFQPDDYTKTIHMYGRCGIFGYAVEDRDTIPSQVQKELIAHGIDNVRIVNHGLWGGSDTYLDHNFIQDSISMKEGDIVIFYRKHFDKRLMHQLEQCGVWYKNITDEWHLNPATKNCFFDKPGHMNHVGYRIVSCLICEDLIKHDFAARPVSPVMLENFDNSNLTGYLKEKTNIKFNDEINKYTDRILKEFPLTDNMKKCGAIVMNCNPFTKGHRYLIEYAAKKVDRLYIFVVEEDKSFFKFKDRFEMVCQGIADLKNVVVVPSGKFIISSFTFPEYFMKDYVKEKNFDVTNDVQIFCKYIAPALKISVRFAGEEPLDPVTFNYNENMKKILPEYSMEFCEIPRMMLDKEHVVNATEVRWLLKQKDFNSIKDYVPETTLKILDANYSDL